MPFSAPWRNYQAGDIFYGLARHRSNLAQSLGINVNQDLYVIDRYDIFAAAGDPRAATNGLAHDQGFVNALLNNVKTANLVGTDLNDANFWQTNLNSAILVAKRKCKSGIEYICKSTTSHIHFCLEGMNLVQAAGKNYDGGARGVADGPGRQRAGADPFQKPRSITGAELRKVYRLKEDPQIAAKVQFWKYANGWVQCPPPWLDSGQSNQVRAAFAAYGDSRRPPDIDMPDIDTAEAMDIG